MLKIKTIPVLTRMIAKIDLKPILNTLKNADIFDKTDNKADVMKQLTKEKAAELAFAMLGEITAQLDKIGDDIPEFVALYKGVSIEEAGEFDIAEIINEVINDDGIRTFFLRALRKKAERVASTSSAAITTGG